MAIPASDPDLAWIDAMTDAECMEVFWLYVDPPEPFLAAHPPALLGAAMRRALREVARAHRAREQHHGRAATGIRGTE